MNLATQLTHAECDRILYERVRLGLVAEGLLPDRTQFDSEAAYENKKRQMEAQKIPVTEWFPHRVPLEKAAKLQRYIWINREAETANREMGLTRQPLMKPTEDGTAFEKFRFTEEVKDLTYLVVYCAGTLEHEARLRSMFNRFLPNKRWFPGLDANLQPKEGKGFLQFLAETDTSNEKFIEKTRAYQLKRLYLTAPETMAIVPKITKVTIGVEVLEPGKPLSNEV